MDPVWYFLYCLRSLSYHQRPKKHDKDISQNISMSYLEEIHTFLCKSPIPARQEHNSDEACLQSFFRDR